MSGEPANVIYLSKPKRFLLEEARKLLPQVREITELAMQESEPWILKLQDETLSQEEREQVSKDLRERLDGWAGEIAKLGAVAKGLWLVDFDSGSGYYCWRYDETDLTFFHGYDEGFSGRTPIQ